MAEVKVPTPAERAQRTPAGLAAVAYPGYRLLPIHDLFNRVMMFCAAAAAQPDNRRLDPWRRVIVNVSSRTGKSDIFSVYGPAWMLGQVPDLTAAIIGYEAGIAEGWSSTARNVIQELGPAVFGVTTDPRSEAKDWWGIQSLQGRTFRGGMRAMGIGGPAMGKGFNYVGIDDPIKNTQEALSPAVREAHWLWWQGTIKNRVEPGGVVVVVMQRWHEDDLSGRLFREEGLYSQGGEWTPIVVPLEAEPITSAHVPGLLEELPDPLRRQPGEMHATRYSAREIERLRKSTLPWLWAAQRQQRPTSPGGSIFRREWLRYYEETPFGYRLQRYPVAGHLIVQPIERGQIRRFATMDLAVSTANTADYTVLAVWGVTPNNDLLLLDLYRDRLEAPDQDKLVESVWGQYRYSGTPLQFIGVESVAYQLSMVQRLRRKGLPVRKLDVDEDKISRANTAAVRMEGEGLFLPAAPKPWKQRYVDELLSFPRGTHDDQVDCTSHAVAATPDVGGTVNIRVVE